MADGLGYDVGTDATILTDDTGAGGHAQVVKLAYGADGVATLAQLDADGLLVNLGANNDITGTVTANLGATDNAVLDAIAAAAAAIQAAVEILDNVVAGSEAQVDIVSSALPTGAATEATLAAIDAGKLEEATFTGRVGEVQASPTANTLLARLKTIGDALAGTLVVNGSGVTQPVSGTVTAELGATDNAVLDDIAAKLATIDADTSAIAAAVAGTEVQVDIVSLPAVDTELTTGDLDTGVGTDTRAVVGLVGSASGGGQLIPGSSADGLLVNLGANNDITGTVDLGATDNAVLDAIAAAAAAIQAAVEILDNVVAGSEAQVDIVSSALPTGAATEATLAAIDAGKLEEATFTARVGEVQASPTANTLLARLKTIGDALAGTLVVNGSGVTQPVSGTVTAELGATDNAVLDDIAAKLGTIDADTSALAGAVAGTEVQVDVVAALPAGTNAIGKLAANSGVDIGDVDVTSIAAGTNVIGATLDVSGLMIENAVSVTVKYAAIDAATSGDNTIVAAVAGKKIRVLSLFLVAAGTVNVRFENGAGGTALTGQMNLIANTGFVLPYNPHGWFQCGSDNTLLNMELSAAVSVDGSLTYIEAE